MPNRNVMWTYMDLLESIKQRKKNVSETAKKVGICRSEATKYTDELSKRGWIVKANPVKGAGGERILTITATGRTALKHLKALHRIGGETPAGPEV